jgi:hypothetical protein
MKEVTMMMKAWKVLPMKTHSIVKRMYKKLNDAEVGGGQLEK